MVRAVQLVVPIDLALFPGGTEAGTAGGTPAADPQTDHSRPCPLKRASSPSWLISRELPWLAWWQELILNWVSSWNTIADLTITSADREWTASWDIPTDLELARMELEELIER